MPDVERPLLTHLPIPAERIRFAELGEFPTRIDEARAGAARPLLIKRDDLSSPFYGGNKVRTLETLFGDALASGATRIHSTGAYGSNHGLATILHARRVGLEPGVLLFPQPISECARENLRAMLSLGPIVRDLPHWSALPFGMFATARADAKAGTPSVVMMPGGATPVGGLGYVNAALELAAQVARGECAAPTSVVVGIGSTCTTAGLLVGFRLAASIGLGFTTPPMLVAVRVTPWPVTSRMRILSLAVEIGRLVAERSGGAVRAPERRELGAALEVDGSELGWGYGFPTDRGRSAIAWFRDHAGFTLDSTYSGKAAAAALRRAESSTGRVLFWSTKSTAALPADDAVAIGRATPRMRRWLARADAVIAARHARGIRIA